MPSGMMFGLMPSFLPFSAKRSACSLPQSSINFRVSPGKSLIGRFYKLGPFIGVASDLISLVAVNMCKSDIIAFIFPFVKDVANPP